MLLWNDERAAEFAAAEKKKRIEEKSSNDNKILFSNARCL
jgi:hypothetical protein